MKKVDGKHVWCYSLLMGIAVGGLQVAMLHAAVQVPIVLTQLPTGTEAQTQGSQADGMLRADYGAQGRLIRLEPDQSITVLSEGFHSACDPAVSFDGIRLLFAGKRKAGDHWHIFEMAVDGSDLRQVTQGTGDHRAPNYQPTFYTIVSPKPWYQLSFMKAAPGALNEAGLGPAWNLYSCKVDGTALRRLTYNLSSDMDPFVMPDGRILLASWQRANLLRGLQGRISLFGVNTDGADYAAFCNPEQGKRIKHMPCTTTSGLAVFVESDRLPWDGAGTLGAVSLRRPLHDYRALTQAQDGLFHSPFGLPDGSLLVSRRSVSGDDTHGLYRIDPVSSELELLYDTTEYHEMQARPIVARPEPDGRSSVVTEEDPYGKLYCLNVNINDMDIPAGLAKRLRVLEGIPVTDHVDGDSPKPRLAQRRILGEIDLCDDGSFNIEIPAGIPIELQTLDTDGMALRSCAWIWAKNHEPRGCIGCHEDGELTPENTLVEAVQRPSIKLTLAPEQRRTVDFRRDVMPIITAKCVQCHQGADATVRLTEDLNPVSEETDVNLSYLMLLTPGSDPGQGRYVHPGRARTSPVIWHVFGRNTSRPWDDRSAQQAFKPMPADSPVTLTEDEKRTLVEWVDMGAMWDGIPKENSSEAGGHQP